MEVQIKIPVTVFQGALIEETLERKYCLVIHTVQAQIKSMQVF